MSQHAVPLSDSRSTSARMWPSLLERLVLSYNGWRDGGHEIPAWNPDGAASPSTPHLVAIADRALGLVECERVALVAATSEVHRRHAELIAELAHRTHRHEQLKGADDEPAPIGKHEKAVRRAGEDRLDLNLVQERRRLEHARLLEAHRARVNGAFEDLEFTKSQLDLIPMLLDDCHRRVIARVDEIRHVARQHGSIYWRALCRKHPHGHRLATAWHHWSPDDPAESEHGLTTRSRSASGYQSPAATGVAGQLCLNVG